MFAGLVPVAQIILAVAVSLVVILVLIIILFKGIRVNSGKLAVEVSGKKLKKGEKKETIYYVFSADDMEQIIDILSSFLEHIYEVSDTVAMQKKMDMVENRLTTIYEYKDQFFCSKLIEKGIAANSVTNHVDYLHYRQVVDRLLYLDDSATPSFKSMLRKYLRDKNYATDSNLSESENKNRFEKFISNVVDEIVQKTKRTWYDNYRSDVFDGTTTRKRAISVEEITEFEENSKSVEVLKGVLIEIFKHSVQVDTWVDKEREVIKEDRKKKIQMFLLKRKEE